MRSRVRRLDTSITGPSLNQRLFSLQPSLSWENSPTSGLFSGDHMLHKSAVEDVSKIRKMHLKKKEKQRKQQIIIL